MQSVINIINIILLIGIIQGIIFTIIMLTKINKRAIIYLSLIIFFLSLNNLQAWLVEKDLIKINYYINYLHVSWNIFLAPMFYLFLTYYLKVKKPLKKILIVTIFIFLITLVGRLIALNYIKPQFQTSQFYTFLKKYNSYEDIFVFLYTLPIFILSFYLFFRQRTKFNYVLSYDSLKWIKMFFVLCSVVLSFWLIAIYLNYHYSNTKSTHFYLPLRFGTSFLIYWLGYQGFNQQKLMESRIKLRQEIKNKDKKSIVNSISNDGKIELQRFNELKQFIINNKSFLNPQLSLTTLAADLNTNTSDLSKLINNYSNSNFTDFINRFRVNYVKGLITNRDYKNYTVVTIGLESGFNSKSVFYAAFKKFTQQTPAEYRKSYIKKQYN